jgi:hypothetical protein
MMTDILFSGSYFRRLLGHFGSPNKKNEPDFAIPPAVIRKANAIAEYIALLAL